VYGCKWVEKYRGGKGLRGQGGGIPEIIVEWFGPPGGGCFQPPEKQHLVRNSDIYFRREGREEINVGRFVCYRGAEERRGQNPPTAEIYLTGTGRMPLDRINGIVRMGRGSKIVF
jgi:hypothetical protein